LPVGDVLSLILICVFAICVIAAMFYD